MKGLDVLLRLRVFIHIALLAHIPIYPYYLNPPSTCDIPPLSDCGSVSPFLLAWGCVPFFTPLQMYCFFYSLRTYGSLRFVLVDVAGWRLTGLVCFPCVCLVVVCFVLLGSFFFFLLSFCCVCLVGWAFSFVLVGLAGGRGGLGAKGWKGRGRCGG